MVKSLLTLAAACAVGAATANAALVTYSKGDLLMGFQATSGTGSSTVYVVNLGAASNYRDDVNTGTVSIGDIGTDLAAIYGANWNTRNDLFWGIIGTSSNISSETVNGDIGRVLYVSQPQVTTGDAGVGPAGLNATQRGDVANKVVAMGGTFDNYQSTGNSSVAASEGSGDANSWNSYLAPGGVNSGGGVLDYGAFSQIEGTTSQTLSLFRVFSATSSSSFEGQFSLSSNGTLTFVPEPTSAALAGLGTVLLVFRRRRSA
ncbi:PEP-CTERM sorting domain-containing protein [Luteolibacter sp. Y139]|uniref:PEP-CTERM sorting domain-containing protein n=2 Tax=Luteolibacter soli TaxID=3135280 RepID=A0ABU9AWR6_9BACT